MLKVTIVCSYLKRLGPTNVIYNMLEAYYKKATSDICFEIITISPENGDSRIDEFRKLGINVKCANIKPGVKGLFHIKRLKDLILSTFPDIVHSYGFRADILVGLMNLGKIPKVSSLFNNPYDDYGMLFGKIKGYLMAIIHLRVLKSFNKVIVCSEFIHSRIKNSNLNLTVIYTGVPSDYFIPLNNEERRKQRLRLNISTDAIVYLFVGNLIPRKNPLFLIEAFKQITNPNSLLIIMGDGPLMDECRQLVNENKHIRLIGAQKGTLEYLQISDYYISASYSEGFPTAVLEAMSVNVSPILSDIGPHREMVKDFNANHIFTNNDLDNLNKILNLLNEETISYRDIFLKNFSSSVMQQKYTQLYKDLVATL